MSRQNPPICCSRRHCLRYLRALLLAPAAAISADAPFTAEVIGVIDGDTITVLRDAVPVKVRLCGIDAPERRQAYYAVAKRFVSELAFGKTVRVEPRDRDRWKRIVAVLKVSDRRVLNREIVRAGYAWHFVRYAPDDRTLQRLEAEARKAQRGLWNEHEPTPPWEWRVNAMRLDVR